MTFTVSRISSALAGSMVTGKISPVWKSTVRAVYASPIGLITEECSVPVAGSRRLGAAML
jgi:hypothetical protein